jgi:ADP-heptose:LPS heptosyltransferase
VQTIPNKVPYVKAPELAARKWSSRLAAMPRPRVGLAWAGSPAHLNDHNRSIALRTLAPLLAVEGVHFVSLQKEVAAADAALLRKHGVTQLGGELSDFSDTAAAIAALDLVVSVDTAVAHLAGAMGKAVLLLLPFLPDWRWMLDRADSPWYPTLRLFRQERSGDWSDPIERLRQVLPIAARREAAKQPRT